MSKQEGFSDTVGFLSKFGEGVLMKDYREIEPNLWIHTGNYIYNAQISGSILRGAASNKIITIAGDPKTGKSYLAYNIMANAQEVGYTPYFFETEGAPIRERLLSHGIDLDNAVMEQPETPDDILTPFVRITDEMANLKKKGKELPRIMFVIDSTTGLASSKQLDDAREGKSKQDMGTLAKDLKKLFKIMSNRCNKYQIPVICTAHVYEKDYGSFRKKTPTGGYGQLFLSSSVSLLRKQKEKDKKTKRQTGIRVTSEPVESRFAALIDVSFEIDFEKGMNPYIGLEDYVSWSTCGIQRGKFVDMVDIYKVAVDKKVIEEMDWDAEITRAEIRNMLPKSKREYTDAYIRFMIDKGYLKPVANEKYRFTKKLETRYEKDGGYEEVEGQAPDLNPNSTRWAIKHLGEAIETKDLHTPEVFTDEVLKQLDEIIREEFRPFSDEEEVTQKDQPNDEEE